MNTKSIRLTFGTLITSFLLALQPTANADPIKLNYWRDATVEGTLLVLNEVKDGEDVLALTIVGGLIALSGNEMYSVKFGITNNGTYEKVVPTDAIRITLGGQSFAMTSFAAKMNGEAKFGSEITLQPGQSFEGFAYYCCPVAFGNSVRKGNGRLRLR